MQTGANQRANRHKQKEHGTQAPPQPHSVRYLSLCALLAWTPAGLFSFNLLTVYSSSYYPATPPFLATDTSTALSQHKLHPPPSQQASFLNPKRHPLTPKTHLP